MDIIVTTPKTQMANAAREAADAIEAGGGDYFRRLPSPANIKLGERVFYVEDGYIRGFAVVRDTVVKEHANPQGFLCDTTGRRWSQGFYVVMDARTWTWIEPIPYRGFMGYRYARGEGQNPNVINHPTDPDRFAWIREVGGWRDPKPNTQQAIARPVRDGEW